MICEQCGFPFTINHYAHIICSGCRAQNMRDASRGKLRPN